MKKGYNNILLLSFFLVVAAIAFPDAAQALQTGTASGQLEAGGKSTGLTNTDPRLLIATIIQASLGVLGTIFAGLMVLAGYWLLIARGREDYIENAKKTMLRAVVGMLLILGAYSITTLVKSGVEELGNPDRDSSGGMQGGGIDVTGSSCCMICDRSDGRDVCNFDTFNSSNREFVKDIYGVPVTPDRCGALNVLHVCITADNCVITEVTDSQCNLARPVPTSVYDD